MERNELIRRAKEKDTDALDTIYRTYYPRMAGVCMNICREDKATVDDLVHDAFVLAFVSIGSLREGARLGEWLTTIVRNVALKHVAQRQRMRRVPLSSVEDAGGVFADAASSADSELSRKELLALVCSAFPQYRFVSLCSPADQGYDHQAFIKASPHTRKAAIERLLISADLLLKSRQFAGSITTGPSVFIMKVRASDPAVGAADCPRQHLKSVLTLTIDRRTALSRQQNAVNR